MGTTTGTLRQGPTTVRAVRGGGGLRLHVASGAGRTGGRSCSSTAGSRAISAGPSSTTAPWPRSSGWSPLTCAATACWRRPPNPGHYTNGRLWADDLAAIIDQLGLDRPVLVGWSYGGFIICDYLRAHGTGQPGQPVVAGVATTLGEAASGR